MKFEVEIVVELKQNDSQEVISFHLKIEVIKFFLRVFSCMKKKFSMSLIFFTCNLAKVSFIYKEKIVELIS